MKFIYSRKGKCYPDYKIKEEILKAYKKGKDFHTSNELGINATRVLIKEGLILEDDIVFYNGNMIVQFNYNTLQFHSYSFESLWDSYLDYLLGLI